MCMIDCQVNLQIGLIYNIFNGTVSNLSPSTGKTALLFDSDGTGSINANTVNILQTEYKSNTLGQVFKAQPGGKFIGAPNLNNPTHRRGALFISTTPQTTTLGGTMKYIEHLQVDGEPIASPKVSVGIAFDAFGNVYYSGGTYLGGFLNYDSGYVFNASMLVDLSSKRQIEIVIDNLRSISLFAAEVD
ncbi:hypothetical protein BGZ67_010621 [Mortierella alpina]|nr:hypothetical protein BGZ67_010621 [Mortierella alpina]